MLSRKRFVLLAAALPYIAVILAFLLNSKPDTAHFFIRLFALLGIVTLFLAIISSAFTRWLSITFGRTFKKIHHLLSISGLVLITLHPVVVALNQMDLGIFIPRFDSWDIFWALAGRPALIIIYAVLAAALLMKTIPRYWRYIHAFAYIAFIFGVVHGLRVGADLQNTPMIVVFILMAVIAVGVFAYRRLRPPQQKVKSRLLLLS